VVEREAAIKNLSLPAPAADIFVGIWKPTQNIRLPSLGARPLCVRMEARAGEIGPSRGQAAEVRAMLPVCTSETAYVYYSGGGGRTLAGHVARGGQTADSGAN